MKRPYILVAGLVLVSSPPVPACSPSIGELAFWHRHHPAADMATFLDGELEVLDQRQSPYDLYAAYRYLSGLGMTAADRQAFVAGWHPLPFQNRHETPVGRWLAARRSVDGAPRLPWLPLDKQLRIKTRYGHYYQFFRNCLDDAFVTAVATLEGYLERDADGGARPVRHWLRAQDQVFANCGGAEATIPEPFAAFEDPRLAADRDYQIAAAHFYAGQFDEAEDRFRRIAADEGSPWNALAHYLVARVHVRAGRLAEAEAHLAALLDEPDTYAYHEAARRLQAYVRARTAPVERLLELDGLLTAPRLPVDWKQLLIDYVALLTSRTGETETELSRFLRSIVRTAPEAGERALADRQAAFAAWRETGSVPRLVAALILARASDPGTEELLDGAAAIPEGSPAFLTATYHRYRLLTAQGRLGTVRDELDSLLDRPALAISDRNRLLSLKATVAIDLDELVHLYQQVPVEQDFDGTTVTDLTQLWGSSWQPGTKLLRPELVDLMNRGLNAADLLDLVRRETVVPELRRRVVLAAWTRALVLAEHATALSALPLVRAVAPELESELQAFEAASEAEKPFVAALGLLRFPGLHPDVHQGVGRRAPLGAISNRDNWWCPGESFQSTDAGPLPAFVSDDDGRLERMRKRLRELESGPIHLGRTVLAWADTQPDDSRVPEALHRVVRATRFPCPWPGERYGGVSRAAFEKLHGRYPASPWTAKTKYWFD